MAKYLAIDTSSRYLTVLAVNGGREVLRATPDCAMKHSVILMGEIDSALSEACLKIEECDYIAAVTGPGSFTGIRIGIATAKGFALAAKKPLKSVTVFDLIAYNVNSEKPFLVAVDAAHDHYYICGYENGKVTVPPSYLPFDKISSMNLPVYGFEELAFKNYTKLDAQKCLKAAVENSGFSDGMHALYVRKSQAEENLSGN